MTDRRRQEIERLPDGRLVDRAAIRDWIAAMTAPKKAAIGTGTRHA